MSKCPPPKPIFRPVAYFFNSRPVQLSDLVVGQLMVSVGVRDSVSGHIMSRTPG